MVNSSIFFNFFYLYQYEQFFIQFNKSSLTRSIKEQQTLIESKMTKRNWPPEINALLLKIIQLQNVEKQYKDHLKISRLH